MTQRKTIAEMFPLIAEWASSTQTQLEFCRLRGLRPSTFSYWHKKYREAYSNESSCFTEVLPAVGSKIEICYPNGVKVRLPEEGSSLAMIQALLRLF